MAPVFKSTLITGERESPSDIEQKWNWLQNSIFHAVVLVGMTAGWLAISWRKWPDVIVDFGRELYIPWRLSEGAVLYRDVDDVYGPLSQYFNAGLFRLFGPGLMIVVAANLVIFVTILAALYALIRQAWGAMAALLASAVFVSVFGFANLTKARNYNFAAPYAHEATHGMLVLVLLLIAFRFVRRPGMGDAAMAGVLFGLALVLKPEFVLTAAVLTVAAIVFAAMHHGRLKWSWAIAWLIAAMLPTACFFAYFQSHMPLAEAGRSAGRGWLNVVGTSRFIRDPIQAVYLGVDALWPNFRRGFFSAVGGGICFAAIVWISGLVGEMRVKTARWMVAGGLVAGIAAASLSASIRMWFNVGLGLPGLLVAYILFQAAEWRRCCRDSGAGRLLRAQRLLVSIAALAMMARMAFFGRIYQFGFYQAALAGVVIVAVMMGELPGLGNRSQRSRMIAVMLMLALLGPGVGIISRQSWLAYQTQEVAIGDDLDRFYISNRGVLKQSVILPALVRDLRRSGAGHTLLVLPEGLMLNYLSRMPSPLAPFFYYSVATEGGRESELVRMLASRPPDWVVILSEDLTDYGIQNYGERSGAGKDLLGWVRENYAQVGRLGEAPLNLQVDGVELYRKASLKN